MENAHIFDVGSFNTRFGIGGQDEYQKLIKTKQYATTLELVQKHLTGDNVPVLLSAQPCTSQLEKQKLLEQIMEYTTSSAVSIVNRGLLAAYGYGTTDGVIIRVGHENISFVPIIEGKVLLQQATSKFDFTKNFHQYLEGNMGLSVTYEQAMVLKEKYATCESGSNTSKEMVLPDGTTLSYTHEMFHVTINGWVSHFPLAEFVMNANCKTDINYRVHLFQNFMLAGGHGLISKFADGLQEGLRAKNPYQSRCLPRVRCSMPDKTAWLGASVLTSISTAPQYFVTREQYLEQGASNIKFDL